MQARLYFLLLLSVPSLLFAPGKGSETATSAQAKYTFPKNSADNKMIGFGWFKDGFALEDATTACQFDSAFPVSGTVTLNGGTLSLTKDLIFNSNTSIESLGVIVGNGYRFDLSSSVTYLPADTVSFENTKLYFNDTLETRSPITFKGTSLICGNGNTLVLDDTSSIIVEAGGSLTLRNMNIVGLAGTNIRCLDNTGTIVLDNCSWFFDDDVTFTCGKLLFTGENGFFGSHIFAYQTAQASTVQRYATLLLDQGVTFSYDPQGSDSKELFAFADATAELIMQGSTLHATLVGLNLTKGTLRIRDKVSLSSEVQGAVDEGITFGNESAGSDLMCDIGADSVLQVVQGSYNYKNVAAKAWSIKNNLSTISIGDNVTFSLYQSMDNGKGILRFGQGAIFARVPGKKVTGAIHASGTFSFATL